MRRRDFLALLGGVGVCFTPSDQILAQGSLPLIAVLNATLEGSSQWLKTALIGGLREGGIVPGKDVSLEYFFAEGRQERLPQLASQIVSRGPAVIVAGGGILPVQAAKAATSKIPIVFTTGVDPVAAGVVETLNRPGSNVTGVLILVQMLDFKRLELLRQLVPHASKIGVVTNPRGMPRQDLSETAARLGISLETAEANSPEELNAAFASFHEKGVHGVFVGADPVFVGWRRHIIALAQQFRLPSIYELKVFTEDDGLISYGPSAPEAYRQAGLYTARILKGDTPATMPVVQPSKFELVVNIRAAKSLSLEIPPSLLARADEVIE